MKNFILKLIIAIIFLQLSTVAQIIYPKTKKVNQSDDYFGNKIQDPYRWLENDNAEDTKAWVVEQNKLTQNELSKIPFRKKAEDRLTKIWNFSRMTTPFKKGKYYFYYKNNGLQNQNVLYYQESTLGKAIELLDPNKLSEDGTTSLSDIAISNDGKYLAYGISKAGSDWVSIFVKEIESGKTLEDKIEWVKFSGISWKGNGFYYSRYDAPGEGKAFTQSNINHKVYYHLLGQTQDKDVLLYEDPKHPNRNFSAHVTEDENFMIIYGSETTSGNSLIFKNLQVENSNFIEVINNFENEFNFIDNIGEDFYFITTHSAPKQRLVKINFRTPEVAKWITIIPEAKDLLESASFCGEHFVLKYLKDVTSKLYLYSLQGVYEREIRLNELCKVESFSSSRKETSAFFSTVSFTHPATVYIYDSNVNIFRPYFTPNIDFNSKDYETVQVFYTSKDGTKIPMFITSKKGTVLNGNNPCFLFGYGGFNIAYTPEFRIDRALFLEAGGIYAVANLRGGGEYGEEWHKAGTKCQKQNVFDDFIGAAEFLIQNKYTSSQKLAIHGRSNGGLLIGAVMTQKPELAKVALPTVGVLDMLRYHLFTIGRAWSVDYGLSENKTEYDCLIKYSPLHNIGKKSYPATLVLTGDHDDRVVPAHSFKFAATLQENQQGNNPTLIRIDVNAGHGAGKPTAKQIAEFADMWSFVFYHLGVKY